MYPRARSRPLGRDRPVVTKGGTEGLRDRVQTQFLVNTAGPGVVRDWSTCPRWPPLARRGCPLILSTDRIGSRETETTQRRRKGPGVGSRGGGRTGGAGDGFWGLRSAPAVSQVWGLGRSGPARAVERTGPAQAEKRALDKRRSAGGPGGGMATRARPRGPGVGGLPGCRRAARARGRPPSPSTRRRSPAAATPPPARGRDARPAASGRPAPPTPSADPSAAAAAMPTRARRRPGRRD